MPIFMIERRYAEEFYPDAQGAEVRLINDDEDVRWLFSFLVFMRMLRTWLAAVFSLINS